MFQRDKLEGQELVRVHQELVPARVPAQGPVRVRQELVQAQILAQDLVRVLLEVVQGLVQVHRELVVRDQVPAECHRIFNHLLS